MGTKIGNLFRSRLLDLLHIVVLIGFVFLVKELVPQRKRLFFLSDQTISFPHTNPEEQLFPESVMVFLAFIFPLSVIFAVSFFNGNRNIAIDGAIALVFVHLYNQFFTEIPKRIVGRQRPDFLSRCFYGNKDKIPQEDHKLHNDFVCTNNNKSMINEGYKSFPSGHSSVAFSGMVFLSLFLSFHFGARILKGTTYKMTIILFPILIAIIVATSRTIDYWHHSGDVLAGSVIGICMGIYGYKYHYYSLRIEEAKDFSDDAPPGNINQHHQGYEELLDESSELRDLSNSASVINMH